MALVPMKFDEGSGWETATLTPTSSSTIVSSYGSMYAAYNNNIKMAMLFFEGTGTTPVAGAYSYTRNDNLKSLLGTIYGGMRRANSTIGVNGTGDVFVNLTEEAWNSGVLVFPTKS